MRAYLRDNEDQFIDAAMLSLEHADRQSYDAARAAYLKATGRRSPRPVADTDFAAAALIRRAMNHLAPDGHDDAAFMFIPGAPHAGAAQLATLRAQWMEGRPAEVATANGGLHDPVPDVAPAATCDQAYARALTATLCPKRFDPAATTGGRVEVMCDTSTLEAIAQQHSVAETSAVTLTATDRGHSTVTFRAPDFPVGNGRPSDGEVALYAVGGCGHSHTRWAIDTIAGAPMVARRECLDCFRSRLNVVPVHRVPELRDAITDPERYLCGLRWMSTLFDEKLETRSFEQLVSETTPFTVGDTGRTMTPVRRTSGVAAAFGRR